MKIVSWNVNGIRAALQKNFIGAYNSFNADIFCIQETKAQDEQVRESLSQINNVSIYMNSAIRKGYSGTAIISKNKPLSVTYGMEIPEHDQEGRIICVEYEYFFLVNVYVPNSGSELLRLDYRQKWDKDFSQYLKNLERKKPVVVCGDFNVAHKKIDIARPEANYNKSAGYMQAEIDGMDKLVSLGFIDTYRELNPQKTDSYSWWSYRAGARSKNIGWRIDYFLITSSLQQLLTNAEIHQEFMGSDHCPISIELNF